MKNYSRRDFLKTAGKGTLAGTGLGSLVSLFSGCQHGVALTDLAEAAGFVDASQASSMRRVAEASAKTFQDLTPEQEYYIGRTVSAVVVNRYGINEAPEATHYLNVMVRALAMVSDQPETFVGYRVMILDTEEINAFAAPGGFIFISKGLLRCCAHEAAAASVLAHEIGHLQHRHGLQAIERARLTSAFTIMAVEGTRQFGREELAQLVNDFDHVIEDITNTMINNGYSRAFEREADVAAATILQRRGYDPNGLVDMLQVLEERLEPGGRGFARTHPAPRSRIADVGRVIGPYSPVDPHPVRSERFTAATAGLLAS